MALRLNTRNIGESVIVDCDGKLVFGDETTAMRHVVENLFYKHRQIVLNFANVTYVDSSGLGLLIALHTSAQKAGSILKLAALRAKIHDLLLLTRLAMVLEIADTVEEAIKGVAAAGV
jgi:anti-sigma B factor antagonist